jgi:hypothetical protein
MKSRILLPLALGLVLSALRVQAHKPSDSYLTLQVSARSIRGEWHLALRDLDYVLDLDSNGDGAITWKELRQQEPALISYAREHLVISGQGQAGRLQPEGLLVDDHSDGAYAVLRFQVEGIPAARRLEVGYTAFFDADPLHRGLLRLQNGQTTSLAVFSPEKQKQVFEFTGSGTRGKTMLAFVQEGIWHIWTGYDHILFLMALLLPGVLQRAAGAWEPQQFARPVLVHILKTVSAFTVAHSITLSLAALGLVHLPSRFIESAIAASVVLAALNNLRPVFSERAWLVAFAFGLIHGFGFANALADLGLRAGSMAITLFGFNVGVEAGQLAIVSAFLPLALWARASKAYRRALLPAGSVAIVLVAGTWLAERLLDSKWLPF